MKSFKHIILFVFLSVAAAMPAMAQFAIGLRPSLSTYGGYDDRRRAEISVLSGDIGEHGRLEMDFGWGHRDVLALSTITVVDGQQVATYSSEERLWGSATAIYQWKHKVLWRLYYYAGLGASLYFSESSIDIVGVDMQFGLEYRLGIPLQISIDYRPMVDLLDGMVYYHTVGLGLRYQFRVPEPEPEPGFLKRWKKKLFS